jgi:hypothetical protein
MNINIITINIFITSNENINSDDIYIHDNNYRYNDYNKNKIKRFEKSII